MKPLELTVYRTLEDFGVVFGYDTPEVHATSEADAMAAAKRFTDTELAAEYWRARQRWTNGLYTNLYATEVDGDARAYTFRQITRMTVEAQTMERFATLPHYDEVTA